MAAPAFEIFRKLLGVSVDDTAYHLGMDVETYRFKEQKQGNFEWNEVVTLWEWLTSKVECAPTDKQLQLAMVMQQFPDSLKNIERNQGLLFDAELPAGIMNSTILRMPSYLTYLDSEGTIVDSSGQINIDIANQIKGSSNFSIYPARDFWGYVWWHEQIGYWAIEITQLSAYRETLFGDYLDELVKAVKERYDGGRFGLTER